MIFYIKKALYFILKKLYCLHELHYPKEKKKEKKTNEGIIRKGANTNKTKGPQVENLVKTLHLY